MQASKKGALLAISSVTSASQSNRSISDVASTGMPTSSLATNESRRIVDLGGALVFRPRSHGSRLEELIPLCCLRFCAFPIMALCSQGVDRKIERQLRATFHKMSAH